MKAPYYLEQAALAMRARAASRDCPDGERSMKRTVDIFAAYTDIDLTEKQGWQFMMCLKMARGAQGQFSGDDYTDGCAYTALAAEAAELEKELIVPTKTRDGEQQSAPKNNLNAARHRGPAQ